MGWLRKSEGGRKALPPRAHGLLRSHSHFCAKPLACCAKQEQRRICRRMRLCHVPEGEAVYEEGDTVRVRKSQACTQAGPRGRAYASINIGIQICSPPPPPPRLTHKIATNRRHTNSNTLPRAHGVCAPIHEQPDAIYFVRVGVVDLLSTSTGDGRGMDLGTGIFGRAVFLMSVRAARQHLLVCAAASICCEPGMGVGMWLMFLLLIPSLF